MSFAQNVKKELIGIEVNKYSVSELAALIKINGSLVFSSSGLKINVSTENAAIARRIFTLVKHFFNQSCQISIIKKNNFNKNQYNLIIKDNISEILDGLDISFGEDKSLKEYKLINKIEYKKAYLRGSFLASGSINNPQTAKYHFEIKDKDHAHVVILSQLLNSLDLKSKVIERNNLFVVYIKEAEKIVEVLAYMGATNALLFFENIRITRDVRNQTNRVANCEQANYEKSYNAAQKQLRNIEIIESTVGIDILDEKLVLLTKYRRMYPEYSLIELAEIMSEEMGVVYTKSKLNHWFRKINEKAKIIEDNKKM